MPPILQREFLDLLEEHQIEALPYLFDFWALPHQLPPEGDWRTWMIMGGRGAGKTRAGAEWVRHMVEGPTPLAAGRASRLALIGDTFDQVREVMVMGDSGLLAVCPPDRRPAWVSSRKMLVWPNGATAQAFTAQDPEGLRGPQFDAAWVDEYGCAAIDKGTNQPNKFLDPKSSESQLPYYSDGRRDDFLQLQYYKAMRQHFADVANNPISEVYGASMVDVSRSHAWAWDTRPFPHFPAQQDLWSDGGNYARGHWLNGRVTARTLASVIAEICSKAGIQHFDVSKVYGIVRGYQIPDLTTGRAALQPLLLAFGIDVAEREGVLVFFNRDGRAQQSLGRDDLAYDPEVGGELWSTRASSIELSGRVQAAYLSAEADFAAEVSETVHPDETSFAVSRTELPLALTKGEAQDLAERWTHEARTARETISVSLPPSRSDIQVGDVVAFTDSIADGSYRIDQIDAEGLRKVEATRVSEAVYLPPLRGDDTPVLSPLAAPTPVVLLALDLPAIDGEDGLKMPYLASASRPWPGSVAVFGSAETSGFTLQNILKRPQPVGVTKSTLLAGPVGRWDRQATLVVRMISGTLSTISEQQVLAGGNLFAIGDGTATNWEVIQFSKANPLGDNEYQLSDLLRGQAGTGGVMPDVWPEGSFLVSLGSLEDQLTVPAFGRGSSRILRYGPAKRPFDDPSYKQTECTFEGASLRPFPVCHLSSRKNGADVSFSWIRQTRLGGDAWGENEVPLGEETEAYRVEVRQGNTVVRSVDVGSATWTYSYADQLADGVAAYGVAVAQVSARYGVGPYKTIDVAA